MRQKLVGTEKCLESDRLDQSIGATARERKWRIEEVERHDKGRSAIITRSYSWEKEADEGSGRAECKIINSSEATKEVGNARALLRLVVRVPG